MISFCSLDKSNVDDMDDVVVDVDVDVDDADDIVEVPCFKAL